MIRLLKNLDLSLSLRPSICSSRTAFSAPPRQNWALPVYTHSMCTSGKALAEAIAVVGKHVHYLLAHLLENKEAV